MGGGGAAAKWILLRKKWNSHKTDWEGLFILGWSALTLLPTKINVTNVSQ